MEKILKCIQDNYGWIIAIIPGVICIVNYLRRSKYRKVKQFILQSDVEFIERIYLEEKIRIDQYKLTNILHELESKGYIRESHVDGAPRYAMFWRMI